MTLFYEEEGALKLPFYCLAHCLFQVGEDFQIPAG